MKRNDAINLLLGLVVGTVLFLAALKSPNMPPVCPQGHGMVCIAAMLRGR
jgi:hypothetical protein